MLLVQWLNLVIELNDLLSKSHSKGKNMSDWISVKDRLPSESGTYLVHSPSADTEKPLICIAWYEPPGGRHMAGWQLMLKAFIPGITHWMPLVPPQGENDATLPK